jgi:hypothetical protein
MTQPFFDADDPSKPNPPNLTQPNQHEQCDCGCSHVPDYGACGDFEVGANGRCVYCDHAEVCHTDDDPDTHNTPL